MFDQEFSTKDSQSEKEPFDPKNRYEIFKKPLIVQETERKSVRVKPESYLSEYVKNTDELIGKIDGTIPLEKVEIYKWDNEKENFRTEEVDLPPPDSVIYLDKSARPVEWFVRELWSLLAREPGTKYSENQIPEKPSEHFLNIDKEDWLKRMGVPAEHIEDAADMIDFSKIKNLKDHLTRIRALFVKENLTEENMEKAWDMQTIFDKKHIMIVDEVRSSGKTLEIAQKLLSLAIPEATFSGQYWEKPPRILLNNGQPDKKTGKRQFAVKSVPIWYNSEDPTGRGIGDRDEIWPEKAEEKGQDISDKAKIGRYVLSTPSHNLTTQERQKDTRGEMLRNDIKKVAEDLSNHSILYRPHQSRSLDDFKERVETLNNIDYEGWIQKRNTLEKNRVQKKY